MSRAWWTGAPDSIYTSGHADVRKGQYSTIVTEQIDQAAYVEQRISRYKKAIYERDLIIFSLHLRTGLMPN